MRQRQQGRVNQAQLQTQQILFFKSGGLQVTLCQTVVLLLLEVRLLPHCVTFIILILWCQKGHQVIADLQQSAFTL